MMMQRVYFIREQASERSYENIEKILEALEKTKVRLRANVNLELARMMILAALFAALTAVGAFIRFPLGTMSVTLQFMFTAMAGVLLGAKWGAVSQTVYVVLGLVGLPVFTMGGGIGYVMQPSFGFLLGLIPTAWVIGRLTEKENGHWRIALACLAGLAVLYLIGLPYMYLIMKLYLHKSITVWTAVKAGMLVYLPGDAIKIALTVLLYKPLRRAIKK